MNASIVVDASVWASWLIDSDVNHNASLRWINQYIATGGLLVAPALMLVEVTAAISRQVGQVGLAIETANYLNEASEIRIVPFDSAFLWATVELAAMLKLRAGDATYVAAARRLNLPLITWDKEQLQKSGKFVTTYTPSNYVF